jgi:NAD(P)-dependent dehydrogenase (short-subunit alcohol dehydrogenase family)
MWLPVRYSLRNKVVVISGGSRGLGLAMAREFASLGAHLALLARDTNELERAAADLLHFGGPVSTWPCDVKEPHQVKQTISAIAEKHAGIDVLVNNAGIMLAAPLDAMATADFEEAMQTHFWAPYNVTMAVLPYLRRNSESRIVNISSIGGRVAVPHMAPYCASKFALAGFSDVLRTEVARQGIRVTTVSPGLMRTGSHVNATFKGDYCKEFAWFSAGAGMPFLSTSAQRAARQIVAAARRGRPELTITLPARCLIVAQALMPNALARVLQLVNSLLPKAAPGQCLVTQKGYQSQSAWAPSLLTILADRATPRFNEGPQPRSEQSMAEPRSDRSNRSNYEFPRSKDAV